MKIALLFRHPFLQPEMRFDLEFRHMVLLLLLWIVAPTSLDALATTAAPRSVINSRRRMAPSEGNASTNVRTVPLCSLTGRNCSNLPKDIIRPNGRGRDEDFSSPPAQIPACAANA